MGRPSIRQKKRAGLTRRSFLRGAGAASALLGTQAFLAGRAAADTSVPPASAGTGPFVHGVASGDPLQDRVILWTRITMATLAKDIQVSYVVATDPGLGNVVASGTARARRLDDYTVKVDVTGLLPATTYYYRFSVGSSRSPIGRTRTLPRGRTDRLRIAVLSCASLAHGYFNAYRGVSQRADLDLVVHLGDYIYEFGNDEYGSVRRYEPPTEIVSLSDYRTRHSQYKADQDLQELHRQHPVVAIWDDHEFADNAWKGGAANHQPATEGDYKARVAAAVRAYYEWMPIRQVHADRRRIDRSFRLGDLAEIFMVEERITGRDEPVDPNVHDEIVPLFTQDGEYLDRGRRVISTQQERALVDQLRRTPARWKLIGQGVMLAPARVGVTPENRNIHFNPDQWDGYKPQRDRLLASIAGSSTQAPVRNAVVLTGDIHSSWAADLPRDPYGGGYNALTGEGSLAVEFIATSVTSPGQPDPEGALAFALRALNPHLKYVELTRRGYLLLDITPQRVSGEWWYVDSVLAPGAGEAFGSALQTLNGSQRLSPGTMSAPRADAPPLAP